MRHLILVFLGLIAAVHTKTDLELCFEAADPRSGCCEIYLNNGMKEAKQCMEKFTNDNDCDLETCYAKERGLLFSNGSVDNVALEHTLDADLSNYGNIVSILKQNCLNVDISVYGEPETCYIKKLLNCLYFFIQSNCPKWSNDQRCLKVKSASEECAKVLT